MRTSLGRITKARILDAVLEGASAEAAADMADMKKPDMAEAAEQLLAMTDWLPAVLHGYGQRRSMGPDSCQRLRAAPMPAGQHSFVNRIFTVLAFLP